MHFWPPWVWQIALKAQTSLEVSAFQLDRPFQSYTIHKNIYVKYIVLQQQQTIASSVMRIPPNNYGKTDIFSSSKKSHFGENTARDICDKVKTD